MRKEYLTVREIVGPLMLVDDVDNVAFGEIAEIRTADGELVTKATATFVLRRKEPDPS